MTPQLVTAPSTAPPGFRAREVDAPGGPVTLFESDDVDRDLDAAIARGAPAPYGRVLWPSAAACAAVLLELASSGAVRSVLELGCGTGLVSLVAARAGLDVLATDVDEGALTAVSASIAAIAGAGAPLALRTAVFDVRGAAPLPRADVVIAADLLYEELLAAALARRVREAIAGGAHVIVGDPGRVFRARFDTLIVDNGSPAPVWRARGDVVVALLAPTAPTTPTAPQGGR